MLSEQMLDAIIESAVEAYGKDVNHFSNEELLKVVKSMALAAAQDPDVNRISQGLDFQARSRNAALGRR